jgi:hypothetical protein
MTMKKWDLKAVEVPLDPYCQTLFHALQINILCPVEHASIAPSNRGAYQPTMHMRYTPTTQNVMNPCMRRVPTLDLP